MTTDKDRHARITSPAALLRDPGGAQIIETLPTGTAINVLRALGDWLEIRVDAGGKQYQGYVRQDQTTWFP